MSIKKKIIEKFDQGVEYEMQKRVESFQKAMKDPTKRIGEKRSQRKANTDIAPPEKKAVERFEQLNKEDRWSKTEYRGPNAVNGGASARISVQDPSDPDDTSLPNIPVEDDNSH